MPQRHGERYPKAFREKIVALVRAGRDPDELAKEIVPSAQSIRVWAAQAERGAGKPARSLGCRIAVRLYSSTKVLVSTSTSRDNNYEVIFARSLLPNTVYRVEIRKVSVATTSTYCAIAWNPFVAGCP